MGFWLVLGGPGRGGTARVRRLRREHVPEHRFRAGLPGGRRADSVAPARQPARLAVLPLRAGLLGHARRRTCTLSAAWSTGRVASGSALPRGGVVVDLGVWVQPTGHVRVLWFPDGRLPSRRWWPVAVVAGLAVGLGRDLGRVAAGPAGESSGPRQPTRRPAARFLFLTPSARVSLSRCSSSPSSVASAALAVRYRRGPAGKRDQLQLAPDRDGAAGRFLALVGGATVALAGNMLGLVQITLVPHGRSVSRCWPQAGRRRSGGTPVPLVVYGWLLAAGLASVRRGWCWSIDSRLRGHAQAGWSPSPRPAPSRCSTSHCGCRPFSARPSGCSTSIVGDPVSAVLTWPGSRRLHGGVIRR